MHIDHKSAQFCLKFIGTNCTYKVQFVLVLPLIGWKTGAIFLSQALSIAIVYEQAPKARPIPNQSM